MYPSCSSAILACIIGVVSATQAAGQKECRPVLAFKDVNFSEMRPPTQERKWTAIVSVDTSGCLANSEGSFDIGFSRLKEVGPEIAFRERFTWHSPSVAVEVSFWADEAVERYWIAHIASCPCRD
jgi:hypothetical protein